MGGEPGNAPVVWRGLRRIEGKDHTNVEMDEEQVGRQGTWLDRGVQVIVGER